MSGQGPEYGQAQANPGQGRRRHDGSYLAEVVAVDDPAGRARVQVRLLGCDGVDGQDGPMWARVAVPFAGADHGAFFLPGVGDEVMIQFINGDARLPVVVGSLWNGKAKAPETLGGDGTRVDRWAMVGKAGTRIAIVEEQAGMPRVEMETPGGVKATLSDEGGKMVLTASNATITIDGAGVTVNAPAGVTVKTTTMRVNAATVTVDAAMSRFNGVVSCDTMQATTVVAATYTPGAGNVW